MLFFRRHREFKTIDSETERAILALHKEHPEFGRKRLHEALVERGFDVDSFQLKLYLRAHKIGTPPPIHQVRLPWGYTRLPHIPWLGRER
jgi:hypothetical protein